MILNYQQFGICINKAIFIVCLLVMPAYVCAFTIIRILTNYRGIVSMCGAEGLIETKLSSTFIPQYYTF